MTDHHHRYAEFADIADATRPLSYLRACPAFAQTPCTDLTLLADRFGWAALYAKDETDRMGLGSFKALGGAYAVLCLVLERLGEALGREATVDDLQRSGRDEALRGIIVCCASAGNHGLSVAAGARLFGISSEIHLAASVPEGFADRLRAMGADVVRSGEVYEDAMGAAIRRGGDRNVILVSDASWEGEMVVPSLVMQGYSVIAAEIEKTFARDDGGSDWPTHIALQAGVGGIAATMASHIRRTWPVQPEIIVVEPDRAPCLAESIKAGFVKRAEGAVSNMGRLDCKLPSLRAFDVLRETVDAFVTVSDEEAQMAVEALARLGIATTPSGAAGLAGMIAHNPGKDARVLIIVTEGPIA